MSDEAHSMRDFQSVRTRMDLRASVARMRASMVGKTRSWSAVGWEWEMSR